MKRHLLLFLLGTVLAGCSGESLKRATYESLHNASDLQNQDDSATRQDEHIGYDQYKREREEYLRESQQETDR